MKTDGHVVRCSVVFLAFLSLVLGGMMYIALRQDTPVFVVFLADIGFEGWIAAFRLTFASLRKILPNVLLYSAPNAFWSFSYTLIMMCLWWHDSSRTRYFWMATIPVVVFGWELLQYRRLVPGTGCPEDLIFSFLGLSAGFLMIVYLKRRTYAKRDH